MKVIAHRGASGHEPENTISAIQKALEMKVDAIEVDIHLVEGNLIVIHDRWLNKTTNGQGRVRDKCFKELRTLDAGKGQTIPILWEVLECINGQCDVNIELKAEKTAEPLIQMLEKAIVELSFYKNQFLISSFNHHLIKEIKDKDPEWRIGALTGSRPIHLARFAEALDAYSIHLDIDFTDEVFVKDAHERGLKVFVYTVDHEEDIEDLLKMEVDGIFTNYPTRSMVRIAHLKGRS